MRPPSHRHHLDSPAEPRRTRRHRSSHRRHRRSRRKRSLWWRTWRRRFSLLARRFNPITALLGPRKLEGRTRRDLLAAKLRWATYALLAILMTSVALASVPLRLGTAAWYLRAMANLAGSSPLAIAAFSLGALAVYLAPESHHNRRLASVLTRLSRGALGLFVLLLPLQLVVAGWFVNQAVASDRAKVMQERNTTTALMAEVRAVQTKERFAELLQQQSIAVDPAALAATPLNDAKANLQRSLNLRATRLESQLRAVRHQGLRNTVQDLAKLAASCIVMILYLRLFVIWPLNLEPAQPDSD